MHKGTFPLDCQQLNPRTELCTRMAPDSPSVAPEALSMLGCPLEGQGGPKALKRLSGSDRVQTVRANLGPIWESRFGSPCPAKPPAYFDYPDPGGVSGLAG